MRILVIDEDNQITETVAEVLSQHRHLIDTANEGDRGWDLIQAYKYDLIMLSMELSAELGGLDFCKQLRKEKYKMPVLILGQQTDANVIAKALDAGADDYLVKPFEWAEFLARFRALLRRDSTTITPTLEWGKLNLDPISCKVTYADEPVNLRPREYKLLELFMRNRNRIFSCSAILDRLWSFDDPPGEETIRAHIKGLRQKLRAAGASELIETVYGLGYRLRPLEKSDPAIEGTESAEVAQIKMTPNLQQALLRTWEKIKPTVLTKLATFEQALQTLESKELNLQIIQKTQAEAKELAHLLIAFQAEKATEVASEISDFFGNQLALLEELEDEQPEISRKEAKVAVQLIADLRQELDRIDLIDRDAEIEAQPEPTTNHCDGETEDAEVEDLDIDHSNHSDRKGRNGEGAPGPDVRSLLFVIENDSELVEKLLWEAVIREINIEVFPDVNAARDAIEQWRPDIVVLNPQCSQSVEDGLALLSELTSLTPPIPVIILSEQDDIDTRLECMQLGSRAFLQKPFLPSQTMEVVAQILQETEDCLAKILAVDGDQKSLAVLKALLEPWGMRLTTLTNPLRFWDVLEKVSPELLLLDLEMPHINGYELCQLVRNAPHWSGLPIIFLSEQTQTSVLKQMFSAGADDFVSKPIAGPELITRIFNRIERNQLFRRLAERDSLTQLPNRAKFSLHAKRLLNIAVERQQKLSIGIIAIDDIGQINQEYGFAIGDATIRQTAELLNKHFCSEEMVGRWSGRKFIISMYNMEPGMGRERLESALLNLRRKPFMTTEGTEFHPSFSGGLASFPGVSGILESLCLVAEADLYQSRIKAQ
jgi:diguanylate cyclase (GGDEF)-like protein